MVAFLIQFAIAMATTIVMLALLEAMRRRGFDPVASIARVLSPDPQIASVTEEAL